MNKDSLILVPMGNLFHDFFIIRDARQALEGKSLLKQKYPWGFLARKQQMNKSDTAGTGARTLQRQINEVCGKLNCLTNDFIIFYILRYIVTFLQMWLD